MNSKRIGKWVIVLFLLAALPGMTAVMAQGQAPATEPVPSSIEISETMHHTWSYRERESNDDRSSAQEIKLGDVVLGSGDGRDIDFFKFRVRTYGTGVLVDTDRLLGEGTLVRLYNESGQPIGGDNPDAAKEALLYRNLGVGWYYIMVRVVCPGLGLCLSEYMLTVGSPLLISAHAAKLGTGNVEGISFEARDILAFSYLSDDHDGHSQYKWSMFLDASDVGFTAQLVNLSTGWVDRNSATGSLAVSFATNQTVLDYQGVTRIVKPWDWIDFDFDQVGADSDISNIQVIPGQIYGLSTPGEKLDAFTLADTYHSNLLINVYYSTVKAGEVSGPAGRVKFADEDVVGGISFDNGPISVWLPLDGSQITGLGVEDVVANDVSSERTPIYLTIQGNGRILNHQVTQKDIFALGWENGYEYKAWNGLLWHGPDYGWDYNIDAFDWPVLPVPGQ